MTDEEKLHFVKIIGNLTQAMMYLMNYSTDSTSVIISDVNGDKQKVKSGLASMKKNRDQFMVYINSALSQVEDMA